MAATCSCGGWGKWIKAPKEDNFSAIRNFLPVSKLSIHTADSSSHSSCEVIIKFQFSEQIKADLRRNAAFKFIVTKQPGNNMNSIRNLSVIASNAD